MWVSVCLFFPSVTLSWTSEQASWSSRRMPHLAPISSRSVCPMEFGRMLFPLSPCMWGSCETRPSTTQGPSAWLVRLTYKPTEMHKHTPVSGQKWSLVPHENLLLDPSPRVHWLPDDDPWPLPSRWCVCHWWSIRSWHSWVSCHNLTWEHPIPWQRARYIQYNTWRTGMVCM